MNQGTLPSYLELLNPEQREAVFHKGNPLLILAGAGSGKTRVITTKIAYLIREQGVDPRSILAVTFTNKAAREMAERARLIEEGAANAMLRTFHSFGAWFLRRNGSLAGLDSGFVIYDDEDTVALLSSVMEDTPKAEIKQIAHNIARAKDYFLNPESPELDLIDHRKRFRGIYTQYEERLAKIGNVDFGDLIKKPAEILKSMPEVARRFQDRFRVILVDEYQDANIAQFELLKELCGPQTYVCVVGDDDQSIYRFRGAEVRNILEFPSRFPGTDIIRLERNYRSVASILKVASSVVDHNRDRLGKTLRAEREGGKTPVLAFLPNQDEEAAFCAELIEKAAREKAGAGEGRSSGQYADWAILYRTNAQSLEFETELLRRRIPYRVVGSLKFYEREEIKDALALLSFLVNPRDEVAFRRVVNKPARGVGAVTVDRIIEAAYEASSENAAETGGSLIAAAGQLLPALPAKARSGIAVFLKALEGGRSALGPSPERAGPEDDLSAGSPGEARSGGVSSGKTKPGKGRPDKVPPGPEEEGGGRRKNRKWEHLNAGEGLSTCVVKLLQDSGIAEHHRLNDEISGNQRIANLQELANAASLYDSTEAGLLEFLEHIELDRSSIEEDNARAGRGAAPQNAVTLITLHNTKGLEFRRVIMTGVEQGVFPREDKKGEELEEERRLFYVGATRAMDELYLSSCAQRRMFGRTMPMEPSLFLREIDRSALRIIGSPPYGFAPSPGGSSSGVSAGSFTRRGGEGKGGNPAGMTAAPLTARGLSPRAGKTSSDGRWQVGNRVFHDDHGYGAVTDIRESDEGPVIRVQFETGKELRFLSLHQSSRFVKIGRDD